MTKRFLQRHIWEVRAALIFAFFFLFLLLFSYVFFVQTERWLMFIVVCIMFAVISHTSFPLIASRLFSSYRGGHYEAIVGLARAHGVRFRDIVVRESRRLNAGVLGFGKRQVLACTSALLEECPWGEIQATVAHEMGHAVHGDARFYTNAGFAFFVFGAWANVFLTAFFGGGFLSLALFSFLIATGFYFYFLRESRRREHRADVYAKRILGGGEALARFFERVVRREEELGVKVVRHPVFWMFHTHPPIAERIRFLYEAS